MKTSAETHAATAPQPPPRAVVYAWLAVLGPPAAWALDLLLRYFLVRHVSATTHVGSLHVVTVLALALIAASVIVGWRTRRRLADAPGTGDDSRLAEALRTMTLWGFALAAFFALLVAAQAFPSFVLEPQALT